MILNCHYIPLPMTVFYYTKFITQRSPCVGTAKLMTQCPLPTNIWSIILFVTDITRVYKYNFINNAYSNEETNIINYQGIQQKT